MPFANGLRQFLAISLTISILCLSSMVALANPANAKLLGSLSATGEVFLNDNKAITGTTVFTDSRIATTAESNATVNLSELGGLSILPDSQINLSFSDTSVKTDLSFGSISVFSPKGISSSVTTTHGLVVADSNQETRFSVSVENGKTFVTAETGLVELRSKTGVKTLAAGESATLGAGGQVSGGNSLDDGEKAALGIGIGVGVVVLIYFLVRDDDDEVVSPIV